MINAYITSFNYNKTIHSDQYSYAINNSYMQSFKTLGHDFQER